MLHVHRRRDGFVAKTVEHSAGHGVVDVRMVKLFSQNTLFDSSFADPPPPPCTL